MSRTKRPYLPGAAFHVTSRIQGRAHCLDDQLKHAVVIAIRDSLHKSDARLIAFAVMSNHLHLVLRQGFEPLSSYMQPLLTRVALRVQRATGWIDHVFGRGFFAKPCRDADQLRATIAYVHRNPVAVGICNDPLDYEWSSERAYRSPDAVTASWLNMPLTGLGLFASREGSTHEELVRNYRRFMAWRTTNSNDDDVAMIDFCAGNTYWSANFAGVPEPLKQPPPRDDLRDIALRVLSIRLPGLTFEDFLLQRCGRRFVAARREIIELAIRAGYTGVGIARFLNISEAAVSSVRSSLASGVGCRDGTTLKG